VVAKELGKPATVTLLVNGTKVAQGRVPKTIPATISIVARQPDSDAWLAGFALAIGAALAMRLVFAGVNAVTVSLWIVVPDAAWPWATGRLPPAANSRSARCHIPFGSRLHAACPPSKKIRRSTSDSSNRAP